MKTLLISLFIVLLFLIQNTTAQQTETSFSNSGVYLYFINGYAAAYKFKSSGNSGYRLNADIAIYQNDGNSENQNNNLYDTTSFFTNRTEDNTRTSFALSLSPQYLYSIYVSGAARFYTGGGPYLGYSYSKTTSDRTEFYSNTKNESDYHSEGSQNTYSAGIKLIIGAEAVISGSFGVFAETQLSGGHSWGRMETSYSEKSTSFLSSYSSSTDSKTWFYELTTVRVGIGIYL